MEEKNPDARRTIQKGIPAIFTTVTRILGISFLGLKNPHFSFLKVKQKKKKKFGGGFYFFISPPNPRGAEPILIE